ncbi:unnamed protein product [Cylicocyclus nassatus]|uniref:Dioxygenase n=1 Tax=Cylicocyclus nassatus TaxID=53992 RepID=A0AA36GS89_CYLNA|nr:unnamed protein product [Cylicocyclus nassatus]
MIQIIKVDLKDGTSKVWSMDNDSQICAEPILVNKPNYEKEDDGILLVPVMTTMEKDTPYVAMIDAETLEEMGRFLIQQSRIPFGFHSHYTPR